jgi:hypothetical protein
MYEKLLRAGMLSLSLVCVAVDAQADSEKIGDPKVLGKTYGQWSALWWQWVYSTPSPVNPWVDTTGEFCDVNQPDGKVWFLAETKEGLVERSCTIPAHKSLFYPLLNAAWTDCPAPSTDSELSTNEVRKIMAEDQDSACQVTSSLDGQPIPALGRGITARAQSPVFTTILPENNVADPGCGVPLPAGKTGRQISDGRWVMLPPLAKGKHELIMHGAKCDSTTGKMIYETGATYHLTVQ